MTNAIIEHANLTVENMPETAALLCKLFGWKKRWEGTARDGVQCVHIGGATSYLALCESNSQTDQSPSISSKQNQSVLNHIGIVVDNLDDIEQRVKDAGLTPHSHGDYEPGRRFYFHTAGQLDNSPATPLEIEVVSYK